MEPMIPYHNISKLSLVYVQIVAHVIMMIQLQCQLITD